MKNLNLLNNIYETYELKGYENLFQKDIPNEVLKFFKALYFELDEETIKNIYFEYKTKENFLNLAKEKKGKNTVIELLSGIDNSNKWNKLEKELEKYNPFEPLHEQKRQDEIDITTLPDDVEILFYEKIYRKFYGSRKYFYTKSEPIYKDCPECSQKAQVYYLCRDYISGEYYIKVYCRHCHKSSKIKIDRFDNDFHHEHKSDLSDKTFGDDLISLYKNKSFI